MHMCTISLPVARIPDVNVTCGGTKRFTTQEPPIPSSDYSPASPQCPLASLLYPPASPECPPISSRALLHAYRLHQLPICQQSNHRSSNTCAQGGRRDRGKCTTHLTANLWHRKLTQKRSNCHNVFRFQLLRNVIWLELWS